MKILGTTISQVPIRTRIPFKYGIATLTEVPYTFVTVSLEIDGDAVQGTAADILPPKWFTKIPDKSLDDEIDEMLTVLQRACDIATATPEAESVFDLWWQTYNAQAAWGKENCLPSLLSGFGTSLIERAMIDASCRAKSCSFAQAVRDNLLGIKLGVFHASLADKQAKNFLPATPSQQMTIRHTVGMADPLLDADIAPDERLTDGLPHSLEENISVYGLTHFKIKLPADFDDALARLQAIAAIIQAECAGFAFTIDGNEFFTDVSAFQEYWKALSSHPSVAAFIEEGLLLVEQPLHRDHALSDAAEEALNAWEDRPSMIIDESDGELHSFERALRCGYRGTSHKNCKGVFKGIANACKVAQANAAGEALLITGEDLMNVGPVALIQDLAVGATLGLTHMERNGHHYVAGLSPFSKAIQEQILTHHSDLYHSHRAEEDAFPTLTIRQGKIELGSVNESAFGHC
jgi:hypothetical protein